MKLETARLVRGSETPAGDGKSGALRCVLSLPDGSKRAAIIKRMETPRVLAEAFCAILLRGWGLNVPDPYLVDEGDKISFASADATYPSLKQRLGLGNMEAGPAFNAVVGIAAGIVSKLDQTPLALMVDEAIDNRDRNLGNILWDGHDVSWIDHELCLGLAHDYDDLNKLAYLVSGTPEAAAIKASALVAWMAVNREIPSQVSKHCSGSEDFASLVTSRLNGLGTRILSRFPEPQDLLSGL